MSSSIKEISINDGTGKIETRSFTTDANNIAYGESDVSASLSDHDERIKVLESFKDNFDAEKLGAKDSKGIGSISFNENKTVKTGDNAVSLGDNNKATGDTSIAIGKDNESGAAYSVALGEGNIVSGDGSVAEGTGNSIVTAPSAHAEGNKNKITNNGAYSHVGGNESQAGGKSSFAHGDHAEARENFSVAIGEGIISNFENETVIGSYNEFSQFDSSREPLFVAGNGIDENNRNNAFVVFKDGITLAQKDFQVKTENETISLVENHSEVIENKTDILNINKRLGNTDISHIGVTITDAISKINITEGGGNASERIITKAEYDALPESKYTDGISYYIEDYSEGGSGTAAFEVTKDNIIKVKQLKIGDTLINEKQLQALLALIE